MKKMAHCKYCGKEMPEFGEANGLTYAHAECAKNAPKT